MRNAQLYNVKGVAAGTVALSPTIFDVTAGDALLKQAVVAELAGLRKSPSHVKTRGEVRGGGRKPWRQKGTGRARHGSIRSPLWRGGGKTFGPRNTKNYTIGMNKKAKRKALFAALSGKAQAKNVVVVESLDRLKKTKDAAALLKALRLHDARNVLLVLSKRDDTVMAATRNIPSLKVALVQTMLVYDVLRSARIILTKEALDALDKTFATSKST